MSVLFIPCQHCGKKYDKNWNGWFVCNECGYRVCHECLSKQGGFKCSQCAFGYLEKK